MRGHFGYEHVHGPFGHHGSFGHHSQFGPSNYDHHGPFAANGFYGQDPGGPPGFCNGTFQHGGSGDCGFFGRSCRPHSPERHEHHGFGRQDRGDHFRRGPHRRGDEEPSCCRRDRSGELGSRPCRRDDRHRSPGPGFGPPGPFGHRGPFGCGPFRPPEQTGPRGHRPHRGPFGPMGRPNDRPDCRCCCLKDRPQNSEDESGNENEGRHGRRNRRNCPRNKDDNRDTVFVQRIVVEKTPRCYSV